MEMESSSSPKRNTSPKVKFSEILVQDNESEESESEKTDRPEELLVDSNSNILEKPIPSNDEIQETQPVNPESEDLEMHVPGELNEIPVQNPSFESVTQSQSQQSMLVLHDQVLASIQERLDSLTLESFDLIFDSEAYEADVESASISEPEITEYPFHFGGSLSASLIPDVQNSEEEELSPIFTRSLEDVGDTFSHVSLQSDEVAVPEPELMVDFVYEEISNHSLQSEPSAVESVASEYADELPDELIGLESDEHSSDYEDLSEELSEAEETLEKLIKAKRAFKKRRQTKPTPVRNYNLPKAFLNFPPRETLIVKEREIVQHELGECDSLHQLGSSGLPRITVLDSAEMSARAHYLIWKRDIRLQSLARKLEKMENRRNSTPLILSPMPAPKKLTPWQSVRLLRRKWKTNKELPDQFKVDPRNSAFRLPRNRITDSKVIRGTGKSNIFGGISRHDKPPWANRVPQQRSFKSSRTRTNRFCDYLYCKWEAFINVITCSKKRKVERKTRSYHPTEDFDEVIELTRYF